LEQVEAILGGEQIDFLFTDGDHSYEGVKMDFEMYSRLVKKDGIVAFHDIAVHPPETGCEVSKFWSEIKRKYEHVEIIDNKDQNWAGIGLLFMK
jgi:predicted O-methyltransferase YrrM